MREPLAAPARLPYREAMLGFLAFLLILWLVLAILGFVIKGLLWLAFIGIVLVIATAAYGWVKRKAQGR
ncbi:MULTISPECIES: hypothetical protein [unclassified Pseudactinotalea]|uniref:hypothetical protein n=1 Tax=unclassified Pseudactinotalea TaxID=2649176 RepID=UPI00128B9DFB|nr:MULTISPECIES: hypothetical protein [unclassified Pseudactinotalea]MPV51447.1 hypothetical protein [Pseudactinotalea sp. HY160]QGH69996.1 hypothetical protein GCE65_11125 [Pseudactinotalea sp. HY158]